MGKAVNILSTLIPDLMVVETAPHADHRGAFARLYCERELACLVGQRRIVQINYSCTAAIGAVRGLHYQRPPHAEMKLVSCLHGEVWDVAVDLRAGSPTFLQWHAERLSPDNACALLIPPGFAHGFQAMSDDAELLYLHSAAYAPGAEAGLNPLDPLLALPWPLPVADMSDRDRSHARLTDLFEGVRL